MIDVLISHATFDPSRKDTLARLVSQVEPQGVAPIIFRSEKREHASVWARSLWEHCAKKDEMWEEIDGWILLNDDVEVSPDLLAACTEMLRVTNAPVISLHTSLPIARSLAEAGQRWLRTYWLTGPGYLLRRGTAKVLLDFADSLPERWYRTVNEDVVANQLAFANRNPIWSCIPALVKHDTSVKSLLGYDNHTMRTTCVPWDDPTFADLDLKTGWTPETPPLPVENPWASEPLLMANERALERGMAPGFCFFCGQRPGKVNAQETGASICAPCVGVAAQSILSRVAP